MAPNTITTAIIEIPNTQRIVPNVTPALACVVDFIGAWSGELGSGLDPGTNILSCVSFIMKIKPAKRQYVSLNRTR